MKASKISKYKYSAYSADANLYVDGLFSPHAVDMHPQDEYYNFNADIS